MYLDMNNFIGLVIWFQLNPYIFGLEIIFQSKRMIPGSDVINGTYTTRDVTSIEECIERCKLKAACKFVNYELKTHVCVLYSYKGSNPYNVSSSFREGFVCGAKTDWDMTGYSDCYNCSLNETCVRHQDNTTSCDVSDCAVPTTVPDAQIIGNVFTTGSQLVYNCTGNDITGYNASNKITCLSNGTWSGNAFTCTVPTTTTTTTTTTSTTTTTAPPTTTTVNDGYTTAILADGEVIRYRIVITSLNNNKAETFCQSEGAIIYGPTTVAKMDFMRTELYTLYAGSDIYFWTDLRNDRDPEFDWLTTTGEGISTSNIYWAPGRLAYVNDQRCARFNPGENYYLENTYCTNKISVVCEKPQTI